MNESVVLTVVPITVAAVLAVRAYPREKVAYEARVREIEQETGHCGGCGGTGVGPANGRFILGSRRAGAAMAPGSRRLDLGGAEIGAARGDD